MVSHPSSVTIDSVKRKCKGKERDKRAGEDQKNEVKREMKK